MAVSAYVAKILLAVISGFGLAGFNVIITPSMFFSEIFWHI